MATVCVTNNSDSSNSFREWIHCHHLLTDPRSMICVLAISKVSRFLLASEGGQAGLNVTRSKIPEDTFSRDVAQIMKIKACRKKPTELRQ